MNATNAKESLNGGSLHPVVSAHCPKCQSDDIERRHHNATFAVPECDYWSCNECEYQWGHE